MIARSNEAKALDIPMGAPYFQYKDIFKKQNVNVLSSNYTLYGQMSHRVMQTLEQFSPEIEVYSIDEAFMVIETVANLSQMKQTVYQWTGIPVSIGVASTKTLAKVANRYAKKKVPYEGYFILNDAIQEKILKDFPVEDVWGIGRQITTLLHRNGIRTAWELASADDHWIKKNLTVVGLRTVWELRGISCLSLEEAVPPKKSIICSRSFGKEVYHEADLAEALSTYVASAAERLRNQESITSYLDVFLNTCRFKEEGYYSQSVHMTMPIPTDYTPCLIQYAKQGLSRIFKKGFAYKKIGVMLGGIVSNKAVQQDFFAQTKVMDQRQKTLMQLIDATNAKYGKDALKFAAQGIDQTWKMKRSKCSSHFTTSWDALLQIKI